MPEDKNLSVAFTAGIFIPHALAQSKDFRVGPKIMYGAMASLRDSAGLIMASGSKLAQLTGLSISPVRYYISVLEQGGLIRTVKTRYGRGGTNVYELLPHPLTTDDTHIQRGTPRSHG